MDTRNPQFDTLSRVFFDAEAARDFLEAIRWPDGPVCPHCDGETAYKITPRKPGAKTRPGLYKCRDCRKQFTVTVGTIFEQTRIPLNKWLYAIHLMAASKKGVSALQVQRALKVTYKSAWFLCHRIRKAMEEEGLGELLSGTVEVDETYVGGKPRRQSRNEPAEKVKEKAAVMTIIERNGNARSEMVTDLSGSNLQAIIRQKVDEDARMMTDGLLAYEGLIAHFRDHQAVDHSREYVRDGDIHVNTAESFFSLFKRGIIGAFHHISKRHLPRYVAEFDFRWNRRKLQDGERMVEAIKGAEGKRLFYRPPKFAAEPAG